MHDIEAAERQMRADIAAASAEGMRLVSEEGGDAQFIRAQRQFDEARVQFVLACLRAENAGIGRNELMSGGFTTLWAPSGANLLLACVGERERAIVNGWTQQALQHTVGQAKAAKTLMSVFPEEQEKPNSSALPSSAYIAEMRDGRLVQAIAGPMDIIWTRNPEMALRITALGRANIQAVIGLDWFRRKVLAPRPSVCSFLIGASAALVTTSSLLPAIVRTA